MTVYSALGLDPIIELNDLFIRVKEDCVFKIYTCVNPRTRRQS